MLQIVNDGNHKIKRSWDGLKDMFDIEPRTPTRNDNDEGEQGIPREIPIESDINLAINSSMEKVMIEIIKKMKIENTVWNEVQNGNFYQVIW